MLATSAVGAEEEAINIDPAEISAQDPLAVDVIDDPRSGQLRISPVPKEWLRSMHSDAADSTGSDRSVIVVH